MQLWGGAGRGRLTSVPPSRSMMRMRSGGGCRGAQHASFGKPRSDCCDRAARKDFGEIQNFGLLKALVV